MKGALAGLLIFERLMVGDENPSIAAEHDIIYAGPDPATVSDEDKAKLAMVGWRVEEEFDCFYYFT